MRIREDDDEASTLQERQRAEQERQRVGTIARNNTPGGPASGHAASQCGRK